MSEGPVANEQQDQGRSAVPRRRWLVLLLIVLAVVALGWGVRSWLLHSRASQLTIPQVDLQGIDTAIVDVVERSRQRVVDHPHDGEAWGNLGMVLYAHDYRSPAIECFANAELLDPNEYRWPYLRGMILAEDNTNTGLPHVRRAVSLAPPEDTSVPLRLAELLFDVRQLQESESIFRNVLQKEPDNPRAKLGLARVLSINGDPEEALRWAAGAARTLPEMRATHELLAKLLYRLGRQESAEKQLQVVDRLPHENLMWPDPVLAEVVLLRADARWRNEQANRLMLMGQPDQYIAALRQLAAEQPDNVSLHVQLVRTLLKVNNLPLARAVLEEALRRHADSMQLLYLWGIVHYEEHQYQQAADIYRDVVAQKPDYAEAWHALANCQRQLGDEQGAVESYRQVLHYEPFFPDAHVGLAELLWERDNAAAKKHVDAALELAPGHPAALQLLKKSGG